MNKIDVKDYINPLWDVSDIIVEESQELVDKWLTLMEYNNNGKRHLDYLFTIPKVAEEDRLKVSRDLEFLEQVYEKRRYQPFPENDVFKSSEMIPLFRRNVNEIKEKIVETGEICT